MYKNSKTAKETIVLHSGEWDREQKKQYKEEMFNGTPEGYANLIDKVDTLAEESIGSFRAINGKIHIKTA